MLKNILPSFLPSLFPSFHLSLLFPIFAPSNFSMTIQYYFWLIIAAVALVVATLLHRKERYNWALLVLTLAGGCVYVFAARLCPYLSPWDEQFHALVAKNCMSHPLTPTLYDEAIVKGHDYSSWIGAHVWLHKQPLFLWQIALCFKLFGISEFTLRLPSIIQCTLLIPIVYQIAKRLTQNLNTAFLAGIATACSWFLIRLTSGMENTDHNDVCFIFYVTASLWAFVEYIYHKREKWGWVVLIGLFAGAAILTKWLAGFLVFFCWSVYLLAEHRLHLRQWKIGHLLTALCTTLAIVLPWQLYTLHQFPELAQQELFYNFKHIGQTVEAHQGSFWYPLIILPLQYFGHGHNCQTDTFAWNLHAIICYIVLGFGYYKFIMRLQKSSWRWTIACTTLFVFVFFGMASTKMPAFTFILCSFGFLSIACALTWAIEGICRFIKNPRIQPWVILLCVVLSAYYQLNYPHYFQCLYKDSQHHNLDNKQTFLAWRDQLPEGCYVFNVNGYDGVHQSWLLATFGTFYSERQCYYELPPLDELYRLQRTGMPVAIVHNVWLPSAYANDTLLIHIHDNLWGF